MLQQRARLLFFLFLFLPLGLLAQGQNSSEDHPQQAPVPNHLEQLMQGMGLNKEDLREIRKKSGGDMGKMMELMRQKMKGNQGGTLSGERRQDLKLKDLMNGKAEETVAQVLRPFSRMSEQRIVQMLQVQQNGDLEGTSPVQRLQFLKDNPKLMHFLARLLKDPKALPKLASILDQRKKLWIFVGVNIALFLVSFIMRTRYRVKNPSAGIIVSLLHSFYRLVFMIGVRIGVFLLFFRTEFGPFWSITEETFL